MGRKYLNPPIAEVIVEFKLSEDTKWDLTVPGLIYEKLKPSFPEKEQSMQQDQQERIRFLSPDRKMSVQIETRSLSIKCLKPYPSWNSFRPKIKEVYSKLSEVLDIAGLEGIALRYINRIEVPSEIFDLDDYFAFRPHLGDKLPKPIVSFFVGCMFRFAEGRDLCRIHLTDTLAEDQKNSAFNMVLEYFLMQPKAIKPAQALSWIDNAHDEIESIFKGSITDKLRSFFEERE